MAELSVFVDESGVQEGKSTYYLVTYVLHDQAFSITDELAHYDEALREKNLPNITLHTSPLMQGHGDYEHIDLKTRKLLLTQFGVLVRKLPIRYKTFIYRSREFGNAEKLQTLIRKDLAAFLADHLDYFQSFVHVKIYYDEGQPAVRGALERAFTYVLSRNVVVRRNITNRDYRLAQVADYLCAIELASLKYESKLAGNTENKFFGTRRDFNRNWLKQARIKLLT